MTTTTAPTAPTTGYRSDEYLPTFEAEDSFITAGEIEPGDFLVEVSRYRGVPGHVFEHLVEDVTDGPAFHGATWGDVSTVSRVRVHLFGGQSPLLFLGTPVTIRRRIA